MAGQLDVEILHHLEALGAGDAAAVEQRFGRDQHIVEAQPVLGRDVQVAHRARVTERAGGDANGQQGGAVVFVAPARR